MADSLAFRNFTLARKSAVVAAPPVVAVQSQTPHPASVPVSRPPRPGAYEKGDPRLGKPPWTKDRYPAAFVGNRPGSKKKAGTIREHKMALAAAVGMANPQHEGNVMSPDFLTQHVGKKEVTKIAKSLGIGKYSVSEAAGHIARLSNGAFSAPLVSVSNTVSAAAPAVVAALAEGGPASTEIHALNAPSTGPATQPSVSSSEPLLEPVHGGIGAGGNPIPDTPARPLRVSGTTVRRYRADGKPLTESPPLRSAGGARAPEEESSSVFSSPFPDPVRD